MQNVLLQSQRCHYLSAGKKIQRSNTEFINIRDLWNVHGCLYCTTNEDPILDRWYNIGNRGYNIGHNLFMILHRLPVRAITGDSRLWFNFRASYILTGSENSSQMGCSQFRGAAPLDDKGLTYRPSKTNLVFPSKSDIWVCRGGGCKRPQWDFFETMTDLGRRG